MSLRTNVEARISSQKLLELTNPENRAASSVNTSLLDTACTDVVADLAIHAGLTYDDTNALHVTVAVEGVVLKLRAYAKPAAENTDAQYQRWLERRVAALAKVTSRDRIWPETNSELEPSSETRGGIPRRPRFDEQKFDGIKPL